MSDPPLGRIAGRAERLAQERARRRAGEVAARLSAELGPKVRVDIEEQGVALSGGGLAERYGRDPELRGRIAGALK